ncbi:MAG: amidohydrolase [Chloroflexi bacterium]|nr:amidohydrolase [Chloroflexota bacterium]
MADLFIAGAKIAVPGGWLEGSLLIHNGRIADIVQTLEPPAGAEIISVRGMAVIPALVNGHSHLSQTFMRGLAGGRPLLRWLKELIWPLQGAMSEEVLELAALLGLAENIRCGAGTVVEHQKITRTPACTEAVVRAAKKSGLRVVVARAWSDRGNGAESAQSILDELEGFFKQSDGRVAFASGPLTPWRASSETLQRTHALARQFDSFTHIHVSETAEEVEMTFKETGMRPVAWLDSLGVLDERCQIVHAVWVDEAEIGLLAERRSPVVHCPVSNAVLGSGIAPVKAMLAKGINLRLGTDGPASNDTQDCFENMKTALMLARASSLDAAAVAPRQALEMAAASGGLEVGQPADLCLINLNSVWSSPQHDLDSALVLCARAGDVEALMVGGDWVMKDGRLTTLDEEGIVKEAQSAVKILRKKAGLDS